MDEYEEVQLDNVVVPPLTQVKELLQHGISLATNDKIAISMDTAKAIQQITPLFVNYLTTIAMDHLNEAPTKVKRKAIAPADVYHAIDDTEIIFLRGQVALRAQALKRTRWLVDAKKKEKNPPAPKTKKTQTTTGEEHEDEDEEEVSEEEQDEEETD